MRSLHAHPGAGSVRRLPLYVRVAWILLLVLGLFPLLAACLDLMADLRDGIPADHQAAFARVAGLPWSSAEQSLPGLSSYVTLLEIGYALHELVFGLLFLAMLWIPFRRGEWWAWWACWPVLVADIGYRLTFGRFDDAILRQSLIADLATPVLLLTQLTRFTGSSRVSRRTDDPAPG